MPKPTCILIECNNVVNRSVRTPHLCDTCILQMGLCFTCKRVMLLDNFFKSKSTFNGHKGTCKECSRDFYRSYQPRYRAKKHSSTFDVVCKQCGITFTASTQMKKYCTLCSRLNRIKAYKKYVNKWKKVDPVKYRCELMHKRYTERDRLHGHDPQKTVSISQILSLFDLYKMRCYICTEKMVLHDDKKRVVTLDRLDNEKGHEYENVKPCCYDCNTKKNKISLEQMLRVIAGHPDDIRCIWIKAMLDKMNSMSSFPHTKMIEDVIEW